MTDVQRLLITDKPRYIVADNSSPTIIQVVSGADLSHGNAQPPPLVSEGTIAVGSSQTFSVGQWVWSAGESQITVSPLLQGNDIIRHTSSGREDLTTVNAKALIPFQAALALRSAHSVNIAFLGDSLIEGQGVDSTAKRMQERLMASLHNAYQPAGIQLSVGQPKYIPAYFISGTLPAPATLAGVPTLRPDYGPGGRCIGMVTGDSATFKVFGTSTDVVFAKQAGGSSFTVAVDGGTPTTISSSQSSGVSDFQTQRITFNNSGYHTIVVAGASVTTAIFDGLVVYNGDETFGIRGYDFGHSGQTSTGEVVTEVLNGTAAGMSALQPRLVIITLGANDYSGGIAPATTQANLTTIINRIRSVVTGVPPTIVLVGYVERNNASGSSATWADYLTAIRAAAAADSSGLTMMVDLSKRMPKVLGDGNSLYVDTVHPGIAGQQLYADILFGEITQGMPAGDPYPSRTYTDIKVAAAKQNALAAAVETFPRDEIQTSAALPSGTVVWDYFTPSVDLTVTQLEHCPRSTAGAGITLARQGIYTVAANGDLTKVAQTADFHGTGAIAANTPQINALAASGSLPSSYTFRAGARYALAYVYVGTTPPTTCSKNAGFPSGIASQAPVFCTSLAAQADLPATVAVGTLGYLGNHFWQAALV